LRVEAWGLRVDGGDCGVEGIGCRAWVIVFTSAK
jgi:hypothetical protein